MNLKEILKILLSYYCLLGSAIGQEELVEDGLYSTKNDNGTYSVLKILKLDPEGVHIRMYSDQYSEHPLNIDQSKLYMVGIDRKSNKSLGMGHAPIGRKSFATWGTRLIKIVPVKPDELEGCEIWKEANAGYF